MLSLVDKFITKIGRWLMIFIVKLYYNKNYKEGDTNEI